MAYYGEGIHIGTMVAGEDLSATSGLTGQNSSGQFLAMKVSTAADNTALHCSTGNEICIGILQNKPKSGEVCDIQNDGVTKAMCGSAFTRGALLELDSSGRVIGPATSGHVAVAQAIESCGGLGEIHTVVLFPGKNLA
jgi:hypothetical protein